MPRMCALVGFQFAQPPCGPRSFQLLSTPGQFGGNPRYGAAVTLLLLPHRRLRLWESVMHAVRAVPACSATVKKIITLVDRARCAGAPYISHVHEHWLCFSD